MSIRAFLINFHSTGWVYLNIQIQTKCFHFRAVCSSSKVRCPIINLSIIMSGLPISKIFLDNL